MAAGAQGLDSKSAELRTSPESRRRSKAISGVTFGLLLLFALAWLTPMFWAVDTALKQESETTAIPISWIPESGFTMESFISTITTSSLPRWFLNSVITTSVITAVVVLLASLAAFGLSRIPFRGSNAVFFLILAGIMVPPQILIVPIFEQMNMLNLVDTYWSVILPQIAAPIAVFIFKRFFDGLPKELEEAAIMDGASYFRVYWQIWMPLSRPVIAAVAIFTFVHAWNNFILPFIVITNTDMMTIPVGLATVQGSYGLRYADIMATAVIGGLPLLIVFLFFQRQIVQGIANTGLKD